MLSLQMQEIVIMKLNGEIVSLTAKLHRQITENVLLKTFAFNA